jgi:hypothetical protein
VNEVWHARCGIRAWVRGWVESGPDGQSLAADTWQRLEALPDPRSRQGRIYPLACLVAVRAAVIAAIKNAGYLHVPEGRRDHTTPAEALRLHRLE